MIPDAGLSFSLPQLQRLFPYHFLLAPDGCIASVGERLLRYSSVVVGQPFQHSFQFEQVNKNAAVFPQLSINAGTEISLSFAAHPSLQISGYIEHYTGGQLLFTGSVPASPTTSQPVMNDDRLRRMFANMKLGLVEADVALNITHANSTFCELSGYNLNELMGKNLPALLLPAAPEKMLAEVMEKRRRGIWDSYEVEVRNKAGEPRWWLVSAGPRYDKGGRLAGSIGIHLDITPQKNLESIAAEARAEAGRLNGAKEIFLANMSHEIRTPMNAILGMAQQLQKTTLNSKQQLYLNAINTSADNLLVIINDILDFSKIEAGKVKIESIGFDIRKLVQHAVHLIGHKADAKGLTVNSCIDERVEKVLVGDPFRLNQVLLNLISNAVKFTDKGGVTLSCGLLADQPYYQKIQLRIHDTGVGMSKAFLEKLFGTFVQEHAATARRYGGTGLGMSITKQLLELMGGTISIESSPNAGTTVTINLKLPKGSEADLPKTEVVTADVNLLKGKEILLVEDNSMNRLLADIILVQYGASITEATNGQEALHLLESHPFDLVLMDVQMPVMDGLQATRHIRRHLSTHLPIVALTANAVKPELDKCIESGMNDFLVKPFTEAQLISTIAKWIGSEEKLEQIARPFSVSQPLYDLTRLRTISRGNEDFVQRMVGVFKKEVPDAVSKIVNAYYENKLPVVQALAHRIKPSIANLCIDELKEDMPQIESLASLKQQSAELNALIQKLDQVIKAVVAQMN